MKQRVITGVSGALYAIASIIFMQYPVVLTLPLILFSAMSVYEIAHVIGCENKLITVIGMVFTGSTVLFYDIRNYLTYHRGVTFFEEHKIPVWMILTVYVFLIMCIMLRNYEKTKFEHAAMIIFSSVALGFSYGTIFQLRDLDHIYPNYFQQSQSFYIVLISLLCCWLSDAFAYFVGRKLGRHKLAPVISPKKSVEGAIGGVVCTEAVIIIAYFVARHWFDRFPTSLPLWAVVVVSAIAIVMGMCGDLSASVIKRNFGKKDYGTFFPGHGGAMDRFDSFMFALPTVYLIVTAVMRFVY